MSKPLTVYVCPISGRGFSIQIGLICFVSSVHSLRSGHFADRKPDLVFAASGGNLASYIAAAADWDRPRILNYADLMDDEAFMASWTAYIPSILFCPFAKSLFRPGYGFSGALRTVISSDSAVLGLSEIWTGTVNIDTTQHQLFTNKSKETALIQPKFQEGTVFTGSHSNPIYLNGNSDDVSKLCAASASIPWLTQPVTIRGERYADGGLRAASPFITLSEEVMRLIEGPDQYNLRLTYFCSTPVNTFDLQKGKAGASVVKTLVQTIKYNDMQSMISIMKRLGATGEDGLPNETHYNVTVDDYIAIMNRLNTTTKHYGILIFPSTCENEYDFVSYAPKDIKRLVLKSELDVNVSIWKIDL